MATPRKISQLPDAAELDGTELFPVVQAGQTRRAAGPASRTYVDSVASESTGNAAWFDGTATAAEVQAAIDALGGERGQIILVGDLTFSDSIDVKRAAITGVAIPGISGGGATKVTFTGTAGFHSSVADNYGYQLSNMRIVGSGDKATNGQILVDFTGQNNPRLRDVFMWESDIGVKLDKESGGTTECNYGTFLNVSVMKCRTGWLVEEARAHTWWGGRQWDNTLAFHGKVGNNWALFGVFFESNTLSFDSSGSNVILSGCRMENPSGDSIVVRSGAGLHHLSGNAGVNSSNTVDENDPSVLRGSDELAGAISPVSDRRRDVLMDANAVAAWDDLRGSGSLGTTPDEDARTWTMLTTGSFSRTDLGAKAEASSARTAVIDLTSIAGHNSDGFGSWKYVQVQARVVKRATSSATAGIIFGCTDVDNFYRLGFFTRILRLEKVVAGTVTTVDSVELNTSGVGSTFAHAGLLSASLTVLDSGVLYVVGEFMGHSVHYETDSATEVADLTGSKVGFHTADWEVRVSDFVARTVK